MTNYNASVDGTENLFNSSYSIFTYECPGGEIGRHAGLRSQCASVTVRVRPGAPYINTLRTVSLFSKARAKVVSLG